MDEFATTYRDFLPTAKKTKTHFRGSSSVDCREQIRLFDADSRPAVAKPQGESNEVLTNVLVDGAIGTAVGTGTGALAQLAGRVSLFVASPMVMLGWGAGSVPSSLLRPEPMGVSNTRTAGLLTWSAMRLPAVRSYWQHRRERSRRWTSHEKPSARSSANSRMSPQRFECCVHDMILVSFLFQSMRRLLPSASSNSKCNFE